MGGTLRSETIHMLQSKLHSTVIPVLLRSSVRLLVGH